MEVGVGIGFSYNFFIIYKKEQHMHEAKKFNPNVHILFQRTFHKSETTARQMMFHKEVY
jgi:uncharacterized membrane protein YgaE (UPF0421/DUF939 family)